MNYSGIKQYDIANGEGIRTSLFVSGCKFNCKECFNQEAQSFTYGKPFTEETASTVVNYLKSDRIAGLSLLGGDPLWQENDGLYQLISISKETHRLGKTVWLWSGFTWEQIFPKVTIDSFDVKKALQQELIQSCDVWVDGQFEISKRNLNLQWRGSSNQRVIDVKASLDAGEIILYGDK